MILIRIAYLWVASSGTVGSGNTNHIRHWARNLPVDTFDLHLLTGYQPLSRLKVYFSSCPRLQITNLSHLNSKEFLYLPAIVQIARFLRKCNVDVLHTVGLKADIIGAYATLLYRPRLVVSSVEGYLTGYSIGFVRGFLYRIAYAVAKRRIDRIIAITRQTEHELKNDFRVPSQKIVTIHSGIDPSEFVPKTGWPFIPAQDPEAPRIGMLGRLSREKQGDLFLKACGAISVAFPNAEFFIAGDGPERERLISLAHDLGIDTRTHFLGWVSNVANFYKQIDILLVPAAPRYDGMPWVILEGLATCTPVVAMAGGGIPDAIIPGETGLLVEPGDWRSLADAAIWLWQHPKEAQHMANAGRQAILKHFNIQREVNELQEVYSQVLS